MILCNVCSHAGPRLHRHRATVATGGRLFDALFAMLAIIFMFGMVFLLRTARNFCTKLAAILNGFLRWRLSIVVKLDMRSTDQVPN